MSNMDKLASELKSLINESDARKPKPYDTDAEVVRVEGDTLWVHIPGGVEETPIKKTINAMAGDKVKVHIADGQAWVSGNETAPPTDDRQANIATTIAIKADSKADEAVKDADRARLAADAAEADAQRARETAEGVEAIAVEAQTNAGIAKTSAEESLKGLGMTQEVLDVVNWVASHGVYVKATTYVEGTSYYTVVGTEVTDPTQQTDELVGRYYELENGVYVKTEDTEYDDEKTYYFVTGTPVPTPKSEDIGRYYTLNVRDAMGDYIQSHLALTNEGLYVMADNSKWKVLIKNDGVYILDPQNKAANSMVGSNDFTGTIIGYEGETRAEIDYHSLQLIDKEGSTYFHISDLRGKDGLAKITETFTGDGTTTSFSVRYYVAEAISAEDSSDPSNTATRDYKTYTFSSPPSAGATITIIYKTNDKNTKVYTLGVRDSSGGVGPFSLASGDSVIASGVNSHAEGYKTTASGFASHAEGCRNTASHDYSHAEGYYTTASEYSSHAEGHESTASGYGSHAEGCRNTASRNYAHAEGLRTTASGYSAHAEGKNTTASASYAHAEGADTTASESNAHAEGVDATASGYGSHAEGYYTIASNHYAHAEGYYTIAASTYQHVAGIFNIEDNNGKYLYIIGNGNTETRSNAFTVDKDGNAKQYPKTINLGTFHCAGMLTSAAGSLSFTIPTGRVLGDGASISKLTFNIVVRASNSNGTGYYIIKATSGGSGTKAFDSTKSFSFYNANNASKTLTTSQMSITLQGSTNINVSFTGGDDFFSGTSTIRGYINNNACVVSLNNIVVELSYS